MCLELIEELEPQGKTVLDLGCGSGILSIAAARLGASRVLGLDIEIQSVEAAAANLRRNDVQDVVSVRRGTLPDGAADLSFDLVLANISSKVVNELAPSIADSVCPGGVVVVSGITEGGGASVCQALGDVGLEIAEVRRSGDWLAIRSCRQGPAIDRPVRGRALSP